MFKLAHEVSVSITHRVRDRKVSSSKLTCSCTSFYAHICVKYVLVTRVLECWLRYWLKTKYIKNFQISC